MAEAKKEAEEAKTEETQETPQAPEQSKEEKLLAGKYKSVDELESAYSEAQKSLGTLKDEVGQLRDFQNQAYPVIDVVYGDQELMKSVRQAVESKYGVGNSDQAVPQNQPEAKENGRSEDQSSLRPDPRVSEQELFLRQIAINNFKTRYGLDKLPDGEYKQVEDALVDTMSRWVSPGTKVPIDKVEPLLEDAWKIVKGEKLVEEKVLETVTKDRANQQATVGSMSSGSTEAEEVQLSEADRQFAEKLQVPLERVKQYKKRYSEGNFESIIEK